MSSALGDSGWAHMQEPQQRAAAHIMPPNVSEGKYPGLAGRDPSMEADEGAHRLLHLHFKA